MPDYLGAERCCDLVMKGGITSGIVYPPAICRLAEKFYLVGIGVSPGMAIMSRPTEQTLVMASSFSRTRGSVSGT